MRLPRAPKRRRRWVRGALATGALALLLVLTGGAWAYWSLRSSLPVLEGEIAAADLSAPVTVTRDRQGIPTLVGRNRTDLAWALGYLHAQERFFQMDGQRRLAAGELSELVGPVALAQDRAVRVHRFRTRAATVLAAMAPEERRILDLYANGVNRGLADLAAAPVEYLFLRATPAAWRPEDTVLTVYAMYLDLQEADGSTERRRQGATEVLGDALAAFLFPEGTSWDAALDGSALPAPPLPASGELRRTHGVPPEGRGEVFEIDATAPGSNAWAVGGSLGPGGGALVANDMHLGLRVPNIWYRARLIVEPDAGTSLDVTGVTLPGAPTVVAGSNGRIAWGFTNSYVDTSDVVVLEPAEAGDGSYRTPEGPRALERIEESLCPKGASCEVVPVEESLWGPVIGRDRHGRRLSYRWIAHDAVAVNLRGMLELEAAGTARAALDIAHRLGIPHQNLVVGDREGRIGWTVTTALPRRFGFDGRMPQSWADGTRGWSGYLDPQDVPMVSDPEDGRIWTANARVVGGDGLAKLGFGAYAHGSRARQIRDSLRAGDRFDEQALLAIQLDDRGLLLERWQGLMLEALRARPADDRTAALVAAVEGWGGRAAPDSVGYRLVRTFRSALVGLIYDAYVGPMGAGGTGSEGGRPGRRSVVPNQADEPAWRLLAERPAHLVPPGYPDWNAVIEAGMARTLAALDAQAGGRVGDFTWGAVNRAEVRHPLTRALPALSVLLDPPETPQPGDLYQPRVAAPGFGASQRFVVAPGQEGRGLFHMPAGQSGHPLSPYHNLGHRDWAAGQPAPFLPGPGRWQMTFQPGRRP